MNKILTLALILAFSSTASANETAPTDINKNTVVEVNFQSIDTDQDTMISINEASVNETLQLAFADLDLDQNGKLTESEYNKFSELTK